jgi:hypothetical protein
VVGLPGVCQLERVVYYQGSCLERSPSVRRCTTQDRCVVIWLPQTGYPICMYPIARSRTGEVALRKRKGLHL